MRGGVHTRLLVVLSAAALAAAACSSSTPAPSGTASTSASTASTGTGSTTGSVSPSATGSASGPVTTGSSPAGPSSTATTSPSPANPLGALRLAVIPGAAAEAEHQYQVAGDTEDAKLISRLADQPDASWLGSGTPASVEREVRDIVRTAAGRTPVLVAYDIPDRDCGGYSGGGAADATSYAAWIAGFTRGLGQASAIVILEPDAIPQTLPQGGCSAFDSSGAQDGRYQELSGAVDTLTGDAQAEVYLDAGNKGWITDVPALAGALRKAGIARAAGFSLNVSSFYYTDDSVTFGRSVSDQVDGAHFVIDTSRDGNGPYSPPQGDTAPAQCNPPDRKLGEDPTTDTGQPRVDAYLWIKILGESDGTCRGGPTAGQWFPQYALDLVRNSQ